VPADFISRWALAPGFETAFTQFGLLKFAKRWHTSCFRTFRHRALPLEDRSFQSERMQLAVCPWLIDGCHVFTR
jgi:hypothetical protein